MSVKIHRKWLRGLGVVAAAAALGIAGSGLALYLTPAAMAQEHGGGGSCGGGCSGGNESEAGHSGGGGRGGGEHGAGRGLGRGGSGHGSGIHGPGGSHGRSEQEEGHGGFGGGGARHVPSAVSGGHSSSSVRLGRLNAAHAYLSPGFQPEHIMSEGESESPLYQLGRYQQELQGPNPDLQRAGTYLGNAATIDVTPAVVSKVNEMMGVRVTPMQAAAIAAVAEAQRQSNKESHDEGEDSSHEHSSP